MTCHAIEICFDDSFSDLKAKEMVDAVVTKFTRRAQDIEVPQDPDKVLKRETSGGVQYNYSLYRFDRRETITKILDAFQTKLEDNNADWYRLRFHKCYNHGDETGYCSWDERYTREHGNTPGDL